MDTEKLKEILLEFKKNKKSLEAVLNEIKILPFAQLKYANIDHHRNLRMGFPEVIFGKGKTLEHLVEIITEMKKHYKKFMLTKIEENMAEKICKKFPELIYFKEAKIISYKIKGPFKEKIAVISAGTSDMPVAEEAAITLEILGITAERIYDVGVSGIHRIIPKLKTIQKCKLLIVVAGMEGALPSVVAGITGKPVIGVPTSIGYGTNFAGITPLFTMLNSCSPIVSVNIDNGFGAAFFSMLIIKNI
ncbi:MAG: nickel pincer cofactor biosynthesis protein LarB [Candidatus Omnitrophica bacterium]|jgi:NCAIR mutase (PurE)-related protein|nr:nickel pincer cofactor biosynthesis protein LarB [Candidatus Omnitrophota bacterium]